MYRTMLPDGNIQIISALRVEVHNPEGQILSSRAPTPSEIQLAKGSDLRGLTDVRA